MIGYCLRHTAELDAYLNRRLNEKERVQSENEMRWDPRGIRERLMARRESRR